MSRHGRNPPVHRIATGVHSRHIRYHEGALLGGRLTAVDTNTTGQLELDYGQSSYGSTVSAMLEPHLLANPVGYRVASPGQLDNSKK